jgi:hypothetical protein
VQGAYGCDMKRAVGRFGEAESVVLRFVTA